MPDLIETTEQFQREGPLSPVAAIMLAIAISALFAWTLRRYRIEVANPRLPALFWGLRVLATAVVLWMLTGPVHVTVTQHFDPASVAILADTSASMSVTDPPEAVQDLRWTLSSQRDTSSEALARCDRALVALKTARGRVRGLHLTNAVGNVDPVQQLQLTTMAVNNAIEHLNAAIASGNLENTYQTQYREISEALKEETSQRIDTLKDDIGASSVLASRRTVAAFYALEAELARHVARMHQLNQGLVQSIARASNSAERWKNRASERSRWEKVSSLLAHLDEQVRPRVGKRVEVNTFSFNSRLLPLTQANGNTQGNDADSTTDRSTGTNLSQALLEIAKSTSDASLQSIILITDGAHNAPSSPHPAEVAGQIPVPVHVVPIGQTEQARDVILHHVDAPSFVMEGDSIVLAATVTAVNCEAETCVAQLVREGELVDEREITIHGPRDDYSVSFDQPPLEPGVHEFEVRVLPLPDEHTEANNLDTITVQVTPDVMPVALVDAHPRFEFQYLRNLFARDEQVQCDDALFEPRAIGTGDLSLIGQLNSLPRNADDWMGYRVVILGDVGPDRIDTRAGQALVEFVQRRGGVLILIAGADHMPSSYVGHPLEQLIPVQPETIRGDIRRAAGIRFTTYGRQQDFLQLTDERGANEALWHSVYERFPIQWSSPWRRPKTTTQTWLEFDSDAANEGAVPFLCWQQNGRGRIVYLAAPVSYRLRFRDADKYHYRFWGQLLRWATSARSAAGSEYVRIRSDRSTYIEGQPIEVELRLRDPSGTSIVDAECEIHVSSNGRRITTAEVAPDPDVPGRFVGRLRNLSAAVYQLSPQGNDVERLLAQAEETSPIATEITVESFGNTERIQTNCDLPLLRQIAERTGGIVLPPTAISESLELLASNPTGRQEIQRAPLWNRWRYLVFIAGCLFTEWFLRKRIGLA